MLKQRRLRWRLIAVPVILLIYMAVVLLSNRGVAVTIQNGDNTDLHSVVVHVTGKSYALGDVAPGTSKTANVVTTGESQLEIELTDAEGKSKRLKAESFFEPGFRGSIRLTIVHGAIDRVDKQISARR